MKNLSELSGLSVNGLREILEAKTKLTQRLWILIFLLCHGLTAFYIYRVIHEYLTSETLSKIKFEEHDIYHFPNIFLCTARWYNISKMREAGLSLDAIKYGLSLFSQNHTVEDVIAAGNELTGFLVANNYRSLTSFFANMSVFSREDATVLLDVVKMRILEQHVGSIVRDAQMRMCVNINLGNITQRNVRSMGTFAGRNLGVDLPDETDGMDAPDITYLILNSQKSYKYADSNQYVYLALNRIYRIDVMPRHYYFDNKNCVSHKGSPYNRDNCVSNCTQRFTEKSTHAGECVGLYTITTDEEIRRGPFALSTYCMGHAHNDPRFEAYIEASDYCSSPSQCRTYCEFELFEITQSSGVLIPATHPRQLEVLFRMDTENGIFTMREVMTYSFDTMVSNLGGVLGLWLGANMFTLIQLGAFAWNYAIAAYRTGGAEEASGRDVDMKVKQDSNDAGDDMSARMDRFEKTVNHMQKQFAQWETLLAKAQVWPAT